MFIQASNPVEVGDEEYIFIRRTQHNTNLKVGKYIGVLDEEGSLIGYAQVIEDCQKGKGSKYSKLDIEYPGCKIRNAGDGYYKIRFVGWI